MRCTVPLPRPPGWTVARRSPTTTSGPADPEPTPAPGPAGTSTRATTPTCSRPRDASGCRSAPAAPRVSRAGRATSCSSPRAWSTARGTRAPNRTKPSSFGWVRAKSSSTWTAPDRPATATSGAPVVPTVQGSLVLALAAPALAARAARRPGRGRRRPPQARSQLLGHDLNGRSGAANLSRPSPLLEPTHDHDPATLGQRLRGVLGLVAPYDHGEERRLLLPPARDGHPEHGPGNATLGVADLGILSEVGIPRLPHRGNVRSRLNQSTLRVF